MFFLIFGHRLYGRVDEIPGVFHVRTRFAHVWYFPLLPLGSWLITDEKSDDDSFTGVKIGFHFRSILATWLRGFGVLGTAVLGIVASQGSLNPEKLPPIPHVELTMWGATALAGGLTWAAFRLWRYADRESALDLVDKANLGAEVRADIEEGFRAGHFGRRIE